jgi:hypothetical protein
MMRLEHSRSINSEKGSALVLSLFVLLIMSVLGLTLLALGMTEFNIATNWRDYNQALYAAEAGLESGFVGLRNLFVNSPFPADAALAGITQPALTGYGLNFTTFSVTRDRTVPPFSYQTTIGTGPYASLSGIVTDYRINSQVTAPQGSTASLTQMVQYTQIPLFQFGIFYGEGVDLEIAPGPNMTFNGRVHANSNIYVGAGSSLNFDSFITTYGNVYRRLKRDTAIPWGNDPQIKNANGVYQTLNFDHEYQPGFGSTWSASDWQGTALSTFGGKVQDSAMGVEKIIPPIPELFYNPSNPNVVSHKLIETPKPGDSSELAAAKLYSQAGLRIIDGVATDGNGNAVSLPAGTLNTRTFYDKREERTMTCTEIDIGLLGASTPANGVLYAARTGGPGNCVRLAHGSQLPTPQGLSSSPGLTVVSENPVYVMGDYNTKDRYGNNRTSSTPVADLIPAAVLGDAITVLSNNWNPNGYDSKGDQVTDNRPALTTTVNAAFALGPSAESTLDNGNGQLENVIRFLENWSGQTINYSGSIISLWQSMQATGAWRCCGNSGNNYYRAPIRNWSYDTLFNTSPPPGTPSGIVIMRSRWSRN